MTYSKQYGFGASDRFSRLFDPFGGGGALWTPELIPALGWWDASREDTITEIGGAVSQWDDISGNSRNLGQGVVGQRPITGVESLNGMNVIEFDGVDDMMLTNTFPVPAGNVAIFSLSTATTMASIFSSVYSMNGTNDFQFSSASTINFNGRIESTNLGGNGVSDLTGGPFPGPSIFNANFNFGANLRNVMIDGFVRQANQAYTSALDPTTLLRLNSNRGNSDFLGGICAEFLIIEDMTENTRQLVEGYMAWKWLGSGSQLPVDHPYRNAAPTT